MSLRHAEEPERRLTPEEARAFLRVHAEREAARSRDDAPTAADIAEALRLSPEETQSILREARARAYSVGSSSRRGLRPRLLWATAAALLLALALRVSAANRAAETVIVEGPVHTRPVRRAVLLGPTEEFAPSPHSVSSAMVEAPPAGFQVEIDTPNGRLASEANPRSEAAPSLLHDPAWAALQQEGIARVAEQMLADGTDERGLMGLPSVSVDVRVQGGGRTRLVVPAPAFTPPLRNDPEARARFSAALRGVLAAAWPEIERSTRG